MDPKHPVSYLQEVMAKKGKLPPFYDIKPCIGGFICEVVVEDVTTSAISASKAAAKFEAASKAAIIYQERENVGIKIIMPSTITNNSLNESLQSSSLNSSLNSSFNNFNSSQTYLGKHPISELQELMAGKQKPLPHYMIHDISKPTFPNFHCTLTVEGRSYEAQATNKQQARLQCAKLALADLKRNIPENTKVEVLKAIDFSKESIEIPSSVDYNAVGALNEYLQKRNFRCADYQEFGSNAKGEFVARCEVMGKTCEGYGANKKTAKQNAAHNMREILKINNDVKRTPKELTTQPVSTINDDEIITKFTELSFQPQQLMELAMSSKNIVTSTSSDENDQLKDTATKDDLIKILNESGLKFSIHTIPAIDDCVVLALVFNDKLPTTVVCSGSSYEETKLKVLKKAVKTIGLI